jgi:hypothetical protein
VTPVKEALEKTRKTPSQTVIPITRGLSVRRTKGGIPVVKLHYTADPQRDPELTPAWKQAERKAYTSQASWDREQEIIDDAGGGELVFADTLITHWDKIVITDPRWRPDPRWRVEAGFDHGKTNPTVFERCYVDYAGTLYFCGEYYMPGKEVWEHVPLIKQMADIRKVEACFADPTIFNITMQQSQSAGRPQERAKSINELYVEQGIALFSPFGMDRSDVSFAARVMEHWSNLENREPSLRIVCHNYSERPRPGLHNWDCPNLLWEMMRTRRVKLTAQQLLSRNISEAIVDKDNHATDACKYLVMSHPDPPEKTRNELALEAVRSLVEDGDLTSAMIRYQQKTTLPPSQPIWIGRYRPRTARRWYYR